MRMVVIMMKTFYNKHVLFIIKIKINNHKDIEIKAYL